MPVFVSWSGDRSGHVASALSALLKATMPGVPAWTSQQDLDLGHPWHDTLRRVLDTSQYGILCLTPENLNAPWLRFEAGAISKSIEAAHVVPYLLNVKGADLAPPLSLFQGVAADEDGTWRLLKSVASTVTIATTEHGSTDMGRSRSKGWTTRRSTAARVRFLMGTCRTPGSLSASRLLSGG